MKIFIPVIEHAVVSAGRNALFTKSIVMRLSAVEGKCWWLGV